MTTDGDLKRALSALSLDELRVVAKRLNMKGYRRLRLMELRDAISSLHPETVSATIVAQVSRQGVKAWWQAYHNHVYGVGGIVLAVVSLAWAFFTYWNPPKTGTEAAPEAIVQAEPTKGNPMTPPTEEQPTNLTAPPHNSGNRSSRKTTTRKGLGAEHSDAVTTLHSAPPNKADGTGTTTSH